MVEVTIAMAIIVSCSMMLALALQGITRSSFTSRNLSDAVQMEQAIRFRFRNMEFADLFASLKKEDAIYYAYSYRGRENDFRPDGTLEPTTEGRWETAIGLRQSDDPLFQRDLDSLMGQVFRLRITPFLYDSKTAVDLPDSIDEMEESMLRLSIELFQDFDPGNRMEEWPPNLKTLSFPLTVPRWK